MADVPPPTDKPATGNAPAAGSPGAGSSDAGAVADGKAKAHASRVFLVVVDETEEMRVALLFAARRAHSTGGKVAMLYVVEPSAFQQDWKSTRLNSSHYCAARMPSSAGKKTMSDGDVQNFHPT